MAHTNDFQETLFKEIKSRIKEDDSSVPYKNRGYYYYTRFEEGKQYYLLCRKKGSLDAPEEIMVNGNVRAEGHAYYALGGSSVSENNQILAMAEDTISRRIYTISFKNLKTGKFYDDKIEGTSGGMAWANDNKTLFYTKRDPQTLRSYQIWRHELGQPQSKDSLVFEEKDTTFSCFVYTSSSREYVMIGSSQTMSTEYRFLDADKPNGEWTIVEPRKRGHEYSVTDYNGDFYIRTNDQAKNFRLMKTSTNKPGMKNWKEIIPHRSDVLLQGVSVFKKFLVVSERQNGLPKIHIKPWDGSAPHYIDFGEAAYTLRSAQNFDYDTEIYRFNYTSLTTPYSTYDYNMSTKERKLLKRAPVLGDFDSKNYVTHRFYAKARDGVKVPITTVAHKNTKMDGNAPLLLYAYGSYGAGMNPSFSSTRLSLLDRGFVYAIAHIRGGNDLGETWYEDGKLLKKKNTFTDFIDCAEYLIEKKYADKNRIYAMGGSAGGLLMGAVVNMRPELFDGVIAAVPFVDVITTMLDDTIPLTTFEYDEWGNPNDKKYYDYMLSYSPYDQVGAKNYPNLLVTTGLHDSQVQYWEPAKWVAKLRAVGKGDNLLMLKTDMEAGHGGASGRFDRLKKTAFQFAFLLDLAGIKK